MHLDVVWPWSILYVLPIALAFLVSCYEQFFLDAAMNTVLPFHFFIIQLVSIVIIVFKDFHPSA